MPGCPQRLSVIDASEGRRRRRAQLAIGHADNCGPMLAASRSPDVQPRYQPRAPEHSILHQLVAAEADGLRRALSATSPYGRGLPRHVDKEVDAFLDCGVLSRGFARVVCLRCKAEHLVAFSCKGRGICPSCTARRMSDTAAHLVDRVLVHARYRQWVVTFPKRVRYHLAADPKVASAVLQQVLRAIFSWQRKRARSLGQRPSRASSNAAITFVQRFNSALELKGCRSISRQPRSTDADPIRHDERNP